VHVKERTRTTTNYYRTNADPAFQKVSNLNIPKSGADYLLEILDLVYGTPPMLESSNANAILNSVPVRSNKTAEYRYRYKVK
jgi:hypothetical protein